jgi:tol-pal system protein YbgF
VVRALAIVIAGLSVSGCLTPRETRSIQRQVREIGVQIEHVQDTQERSREALREPPTAPTPAPAPQTTPAPRPASSSKPAPPSHPVPEPPPVPGSKSRGSPGAPTDPAGDAWYREGYALYHRGDFPGAEAKLRAYLATHPASPLSDNAQYWIGECRFARGQYRRAIQEFSAVVKHFPSGNKTPDSHYKIALCHLKLGERDLARRSLLVVVRGYPRSEVAGLARERLAGL